MRSESGASEDGQKVGAAGPLLVMIRLVMLFPAYATAIRNDRQPYRPMRSQIPTLHREVTSTE